MMDSTTQTLGSLRRYGVNIRKVGHPLSCTEIVSDKPFGMKVAGTSLVMPAVPHAGAYHFFLAELLEDRSPIAFDLVDLPVVDSSVTPA